MNIQLLVIHCSQIIHLIQRKNKLDCYRGKDCMERFCKGLGEHVTKIVNYEKKDRNDNFNK